MMDGEEWEGEKLLGVGGSDYHVLGGREVIWGVEGGRGMVGKDREKQINISHMNIKQTLISYENK